MQKWSSTGGTVNYVYDVAGNQVAEVNASGVFTRGEVYAAGKHLVTYANGTTYFDHADWLGTERTRTEVNGSVCETITSLPFGDGLSESGPCADASPMHFTGKQRDPESGLDFFGARYNASALGRFMSPDPVQPTSARPLLLDQFLTDPQAWNKYVYSLNNPVTYWDQGGRFTGKDHDRIELNAMTALGYKPPATKIAAEADVDMDNPLNMLEGVKGTHVFLPTSKNYEHGETPDHWTVAQAQAAAAKFVSSKVNDAAERALQGDVHGALVDLGQATHTVQDEVRHQWEKASHHGWSEAPATPAEMKAAEEKTKEVFSEFELEVWSEGITDGLSPDQISNLLENVREGKEDQTHTTQPNHQSCNEIQSLMMACPGGVLIF